MSHLMSILSKDRLSEMLVCQQRARPENASHPGRDYRCISWWLWMGDSVSLTIFILEYSVFLDDSPEKFILLVGEQCLGHLLITKYHFSDKLNIIPYPLSNLRQPVLFAKLTLYLLFNELSLCRLMYNSLCNHSLKCIMSYWLPNSFGLGWNCCNP